MKHIATIFLVLLFGSLTISSTTQELSDGKSLNDDGHSIRLKSNSKDDSLDEVMSLMETVQYSISLLATRQNEMLQKIDGIETKVTDLSLKLDEFKTDMHTAAMNATLFNTQILNSFEKLNNISLVLHQNDDAMNASIQDDRSKLTTQAITNLNLTLVNQSAYDLLPLPSVLATKIAKGEIPHTNEWVVIQRRGTPIKHGRIREEFKDRNWGDYAQGFGEIDADYWIGLEAMHLLNSAGFTQLRVDLEDWEGNKAYAEYDTFALSSASDKYRIYISGYSGNAGDSFAYNNGSQFSTKDQDHDTSSSTNYAAFFGPWWYPRNGGYIWLNTQYQNSSEADRYAYRIVWSGWKGQGYSLKKTEMKLRRRQ